MAKKFGTPFWRRLAWLPLVASAGTILGLGGTIVGLVVAFDAVATLPAEQKVLALADGISVAMACTIVGIAFSVAAKLASAVVSLIGTLRRPVGGG